MKIVAILLAAAAAVASAQKDCQNVSVVGDGTYCIKGPVCSGTPAKQGGDKCPQVGDTAVADCRPTNPAYNKATGKCTAPVPADCKPLPTGVWGCVWDLSKLPGAGQGPAPTPGKPDQGNPNQGVQTPAPTTGKVDQGKDTPAPTTGKVDQGKDTPAPTTGKVDQGKDTPAPTTGKVDQGKDTPAPTTGKVDQGKDTPAPTTGKVDQGKDTPAPTTGNPNQGVQTPAPTTGKVDQGKDTPAPTTGKVDQGNPGQGNPGQGNPGQGEGCTEVTVVGDGAFCIKGPVCGGLAANKGGDQCPQVGDVAFAACGPFNPSYNKETGKCVAPVPANCIPTNGVWACNWDFTKLPKA